jgi:hypothetical protein
MTTKLPWTFQPLAVALRRRIVVAAHRAAIVFVELRLGVKRIDVRDAAVHEKEDDVFGAGAVMRRR